MKRTMKILADASLEKLILIIIIIAMVIISTGFMMPKNESVIALLQSGTTNPKPYIAIKEPQLISRGNLESRYDSDIAPQYNYKINGISQLSLEDYKIILKDTFLEEAAPFIQSTENKYQVNGLFIIAVAQLESGHGSSRLAKNKNNFFGLGAYGSHPYDNAIAFKTSGDCIIFFGELIKTHYIDEGLTTLKTINNKYCESSDWKDKIHTLMIQNIEKLDAIN